ncbi:ribbon-helix-helix protein, CopG family [Arhodomonas aquaeolei]|uniref:ribbon-helix-helix protein, CopG family n=1 Tax=Arhodomonas aquaeolei TaxID=2369 RepID=UPI00035C91A4|nr:ribbon-helix-helix protein, CopG family [Arhodomonas aquaeolei]
MRAITIRLPDASHATLSRAARRGGISLGAAAREVIASGLAVDDIGDRIAQLDHRLARIEQRFDQLFATVEVEIVSEDDQGGTGDGRTP